MSTGEAVGRFPTEQPQPTGPQRVGSFSLLGWALNEEENIASYIERAERFLHEICDDFELILIDDGSVDRTMEIAREYQRSRPWLRIHSNGVNHGSGYNTKKAIQLASKDYLLWQMVDWSYDIDNLKPYLYLLGEREVLQGVRLGSRSLIGAITRRSDNRYKGLVSVVNYWLIRLLFGVPLRDFQNVTVYPRQLIQSVEFESESSFTNPECLIKVWWKGARIREVPVPFIRRSKGVAKGTRPKWILAAIQDILHWWFTWMILRRRADQGRGTVIGWRGDGCASVPQSTSGASPETTV